MGVQKDTATKIKEARAAIANMKAGLETFKAALAKAKAKYGKDCKADATTAFKAATATATTTPASALRAGALLSLPSQCLPL